MSRARPAPAPAARPPRTTARRVGPLKRYKPEPLTWTAEHRRQLRECPTARAPSAFLERFGCDVGAPATRAAWRRTLRAPHPRVQQPAQLAGAVGHGGAADATAGPPDAAAAAPATYDDAAP